MNSLLFDESPGGCHGAFSPEEIVEIWERLGNGQSVRSVAIGLGRYPSAVRQLVQRTGGAEPFPIEHLS
jgi:hypothetical protein